MCDELIFEDELRLITAKIGDFDLKIETVLTSLLVGVTFFNHGEKITVLADSKCKNLDEMDIYFQLAVYNIEVKNIRFKCADFKNGSWLDNAIPMIKENSESIVKAVKILVNVISLVKISNK